MQKQQKQAKTTIDNQLKGKMVVVGGVEPIEANNVRSTANSIQKKNHHRTRKGKEGFHLQTQWAIEIKFSFHNQVLQFKNIDIINPNIKY